jgi:hypothetical protein
MSLRKSPTMTPARIEANRRNARKSTGPRTARGKAYSRMNSLRTGEHSPLYRELMMALFDAPPCAVDQTARAILTPQQAAHPLFAEIVDMFRQAERETAEESRRLARPTARRKNSYLPTAEAGMLSKAKEFDTAGRHEGSLPGQACENKEFFFGRAKPECY